MDEYHYRHWSVVDDDTEMVQRRFGGRLYDLYYLFYFACCNCNITYTHTYIRILVHTYIHGIHTTIYSISGINDMMSLCFSLCFLMFI